MISEASGVNSNSKINQLASCRCPPGLPIGHASASIASAGIGRKLTRISEDGKKENGIDVATVRLIPAAQMLQRELDRLIKEEREQERQ